MSQCDLKICLNCILLWTTKQRLTAGFGSMLKPNAMNKHITIKLPDGSFVNGEGEPLQTLWAFLKKNPEVEVFKYSHHCGFKIVCRKLFVTEINCLIQTNGNEELMPLHYAHDFEVVSHKIKGV